MLFLCFPRGPSGKEPICPLRRCKEMWVRSLSWKDPLEESIETHCSILVWRIPMNRGASWQATVHRITKNWIRLKQLACMHTIFSNKESKRNFFRQISQQQKLSYHGASVSRGQIPWQEAQEVNNDRGGGSPRAPCSFSVLGRNFPLSFLGQSPLQLGTTAAKNKVVSVLLAEGTMAHSCRQWSRCSGNIAIEIFLNANELISVSMLIATQFLLFLKTGGLLFFNCVDPKHFSWIYKFRISGTFNIIYVTNSLIEKNAAQESWVAWLQPCCYLMTDLKLGTSLHSPSSILFMVAASAIRNIFIRGICNLPLNILAK